MFTLASRASLENTDRFTSGRTYSSSPQDCRDQALAITDSHLGFRTRALVLGVSNQLVQAGGGGRGGKTKMAAHYSRESITTILGRNGLLLVMGPDRPVLSSVHYK